MKSYVKVYLQVEFPLLWEEFVNPHRNSVITAAKIIEFFENKDIDGFATSRNWIGEVSIREDHYVMMKLKYD